MKRDAATPLSEHPLIRSKLERPPLPERLVARPRLAERLDEKAGARLTLIVAPAGYGKTTAALQWLEIFGGDVAWISLDEADRDPGRFARYLVAALGEVSGAGFEKSRALLEARTPPPWTFFCEALVAELGELSDDTVLVLEDYHLIDAPEVHDLVELMVERSPTKLHIAVMTRVDPPWPLLRWRTRGWLSELRARDLRFSVEETAEFFAGGAGLTLSPATVEHLQQRTEGWIAGLRLAQLSLSESPDPDRDGRELSGADRQIADYLIDEVLAAQPPEVLEFLAASALMERFSAPLMSHLLADQMGAEDVQRVFSHLESNNLFLVALDTRRQWYRWHHLFRDLLLDHLRPLDSPEFRRHVNRGAGAWFAREGLVEEALRHWIPAGELDAAADLVGTHLHAFLAEDMSCRRLKEWLSMFPPGAMHGRLPLLVAEGHCCMIRWNFPGLEAALREIEGMGTDGSRKGDEECAPFLQPCGPNSSIGRVTSTVRSSGPGARSPAIRRSAAGRGPSPACTDWEGLCSPAGFTRASVRMKKRSQPSAPGAPAPPSCSRHKGSLTSMPWISARAARERCRCWTWTSRFPWSTAGWATRPICSVSSPTSGTSWTRPRRISAVSRTFATW